MAATKYDAIIKAARFHLNAARGDGATYKIDKFWSDDELLSIALRGTTDLWAAVVDLHQEHFLTETDEGDVSLASSTAEVDGVPNDVFRVYALEPWTLSTNAPSFVPRDYNHPEYVAARALSAQTPTSGITIFYSVRGAGAPNGAPVIKVAPTLTSALSLRLVYIPTLGVQQYTLNSDNPIPGESDHAIIAWVVAYALGKQKPGTDPTPDPGWLAVYATEKQSLLTRLTPRQEHDEQVVDGFMDPYWR